MIIQPESGHDEVKKAGHDVAREGTSKGEAEIGNSPDIPSMVRMV